MTHPVVRNFERRAWILFSLCFLLPSIVLLIALISSSIYCTYHLLSL